MKRIAFAHILSAIILPLMGEFIVAFVILENRVIRSGGFVHGLVVEVGQIRLFRKLLQSLENRDDRDLLLVFHKKALSSIHANGGPRKGWIWPVEGVDFVEKALL